MNIPFIKQFTPSLLFESLMRNPWTYALGVAPFCIFVALVVVFSSNAVNLTDGLDGLAIGLMVIAAGALTMLTYAGGHAQLAEYLQLARNPHTSELTVFCGSMTGASVGFLWYNAHPADIFMGDVGSLGLGGAMAVVAVLIKQEVLLVFIGGVSCWRRFRSSCRWAASSCAASAFSKWRRCTIISRRWDGRNRRSSRASGSPAWCWRCSR
jgi:phospho-N-acetylmuramoyl-pentapeptide-transferase